MKYLCKTSRAGKAFDAYKGSGVDWKAHLREHGSDITTEVIFETDDEDEFKKYALAKSIELNVVESSEWANRVYEIGNNYPMHNDTTRQSISKSRTGIKVPKATAAARGYHRTFKLPAEAVEKSRAAKLGKPRDEETKRKLRDANLGSNNPNFGKQRSPETREKIRQSRLATEAKKRAGG